MLDRSAAMRSGALDASSDVALFPDKMSGKALKAAGAMLTLFAPAIASPVLDLLGPLLS